MSLTHQNSPKTTTLISVIGKPRKGYYDHAIYELNGQRYETDFFFIPLLKHYHPDYFYLLGTQESIWEKAQAACQKEKVDFKRVEIPFGMNEAEIWQIFETIVKLTLKNTRLIIDITHGFRAIPFAVFLAALYFQAVKEDVIIEDILYGNYEARDSKTGVVPVVHLNSYLDMHQWIRAARRFVQYGDGDLLLEKLSKHQFSGDTRLVLEAFNEFVGNLQLNFVTQMSQSAEKLDRAFSLSVKEELFRIAPYALLHPLIEQRINLFLRDESEWLRQWRIAQWFYENRQYSQTLIVLREMLLTFTGELLGLKIFKQYDREQKVAHLHTYLILKDQPDELNKKLSALQVESMKPILEHIQTLLGKALFDRWRQLIQEVQEARNHVGHALMRKKKEYIPPDEEIDKIQYWLHQAKMVMHQLWNLAEEQRKDLITSLRKILKIAKSHKLRCFILVNEGIHPILQDLKKQYGEDIHIEIVTTGNVEFQAEQKIVQRVQEIVQKYHEAEFVIVPSGLPYLITLVYNTILQITSKHPIFLQYDRETDRYVEKVLDPRKLMF